MYGIEVPVTQGMAICEDLVERGIDPQVANAEDILMCATDMMEIEVADKHKDILFALKKAYCG